MVEVERAAATVARQVPLEVAERLGTAVESTAARPTSTTTESSIEMKPY
jgi:hypothetical protein